MEITWRGIFSIAMETWELNNNSLADMLGYNRSTVGHIMSGKTKAITLKNQDIYRNLFDPDNKTSPASKDGEKHTFDVLKEFIANEGFGEATKVLNHDNYKDYVMGLLRLARENTSSKGKPQNNNKPNGHLPKNEALEGRALEKQLYGVRIPADMEDEMLCKRTEEDEIFDVFMHAYANLGIYEYIQGRPRRDFDIAPFINYIEQNVMKNYQKHFKTTIYKLIIEFCTELEKFHDLVSLYTQKMSPGELDKLIVQQSEKTKYVFGKIFSTRDVVYQRGHETGDVLCIWE